MTRIATNFTSPTADQQAKAADAINDLDLSTFLTLMITELQNQDPLNPLDNKDMLAQISQIREVGATDKLTETLESVLLGQNIASSTNLIGAEVEGLSNDNHRVSGIVSRISIENGQPTLHLEEQSEAVPSASDGNIEAGKYSYRIVWADASGQLVGIGLNNMETTGAEGVDRAIELTNLPESSTPKLVYRTDKSGEGEFRLVGQISDGKQRTFVDRLGDDERSSAVLQGQIKSAEPFRRHEMKLQNVSDIKPPGA
jgi:flagellar basal-body rod modification protein FlgD